MRKIYSLLLLAAISLFGAENLKAVTVYYVNTYDWATVKGYAFTDNNNKKVAWPGETLTPSGTQINGHDVYALDAETFEKCIFHNGNGFQTADLIINEATPYFYGPYEDAWFADAAAVETYIATKESGSKYANIYLRGEMNGWGNTPMTEIRENVWSCQVALTTTGGHSGGWYNFKFTSHASDWTKPDFGLLENAAVAFNTITAERRGGDNIYNHVEADGTYAFVFDITGETPKIAVGLATDYNVTYNANGGSGTVPTDATNYSFYGVATVDAGTGLTNGGKVFNGWNTASDGSGTAYNMGGKITMVNNVTLYAQWVDKSINVHFAYTGESAWVTTYAHVWNTADEDHPKAAYPGETAAANATHAGWVDFIVSYPTYNSILFNNGGTGAGNQTADIAIDGTATDVFVASNGYATASKVIVHTNADGWATYFGDARAAVPAGITAVYSASYTSGLYATLNAEADYLANGIPAHVGVILKGAADTDYEFAYDWSAAGASDAVNMLRGTVADYNRNNDKVRYVLSRQDGVTALYKYEGLYMPANKAWLELDAAAAAPVIRIIAEATNIENIEANEKAVKFIENGRLLIMKNGVVYDAVGTVIR